MSNILTENSKWINRRAWALGMWSNNLKPACRATCMNIRTNGQKKKAMMVNLFEKICHHTISSTESLNFCHIMADLYHYGQNRDYGAWARCSHTVDRWGWSTALTAYSEFQRVLITLWKKECFLFHFGSLKLTRLRCPQLSEGKFWNKPGPELFQKHLKFFYFFTVITPHQFACILWMFGRYTVTRTTLPSSQLFAKLPLCVHTKEQARRPEPLPLRQQEPWK